MLSTQVRWFAAVLALSMLASCGGGGGGAAPQGGGNNNVEIVVNPGKPPVANAGTGTTYNGGEIAMLDGMGSSDPDGDLLRYTWVQTGGTNTVQLSDNHAAQPVFEVPNANDALQFKLTVNDGYDNSVASYVTITTVAYSGATITTPGGSPFRGNFSYISAGEDLVISVASGSYAYLPAGTNHLRVVDISDPVNLMEVGATTTGGYAYDATMIGNYIYHSDYDATFHTSYIFVTSVATPTAPTPTGLVASSDSPAIARLTSAGNILYVASGNTTTIPSLRVYEVTNTTSPVGNTNFKISQVLPAPPKDVEVSNGYAYVADGASGLRIIDVSLATAASPVISEKGFYDTAGTAVNVAVNGSYAYVADSLNGLVILNVANPALPSLVTTIPAASGAFGGVVSVDASGSTLAYTDDFDVLVYDITTPAAPVLRGRYRVGNLARKVRISGSYLYVTDSQGLRTIPLAKVSLPRGAALYTAATESVREMRLYGDLGFVRMDHRIDILNMKNPAAPSLLYSYTPSGFEQIFAMAIVDNFAYITETSGNMRLLRFRNPAAADIAKSILVGSATQIIANDAYAYLYLNEYPNASIAIYDVSYPYTPVARGVLASPYNDANWLRTLAVKGSRLYLTESLSPISRNFRVADVSNPAAPALIGALAPIDLYGIAFRNNYVLSVGHNVGVKVLDVSSSVTPTFVGAGYGTGFDQIGDLLWTAGSRAYVNSDIVGGSVRMLDMENPLAPYLAGEIAPSGGADLPVVAGQTLYTFYNRMELHRNEREPLLASRYVTGAPGAVLSYSVSWMDEAGGDDHAVKCWVTAGSCVVGTIDQLNNTATVTWTLPVSTGDHEIKIAVGNGHYFGTTKDRVRVQ